MAGHRWPAAVQGHRFGRRSPTTHAAKRSTSGVLDRAWPNAPQPENGKRSVREIVDDPVELNAALSSRRLMITPPLHRAGPRVFHADHGREPTNVAAIALHERANLETRVAKHEPRSPAEHCQQWRAPGRRSARRRKRPCRNAGPGLHTVPPRRRPTSPTTSWPRPQPLPRRGPRLHHPGHSTVHLVGDPGG